MTRRVQILLVGLDAASRTAAEQGARAVFPEITVVAIDSWDAASAPAASGADLVVLGTTAGAADATQAFDESGAPRWAVVVREDGPPSDVADSVALANWNPDTLARVFRSAVLERDLLRENARLRGDLKTIARRISHDLRTPAGCIHTSSDLLDEMSVGKSASMTNIADIFRQSSGEISHIVDRVSFLLRASADPVASGPVNMGAAVSAALVQLEPQIHAAGAVLTQPDTWPEVRGVASWLQVIWWNLVQNALRHAGLNPQVTLMWTRREKEFEFSVTDTGRGVLSAREPGLFAPFEQLHVLKYPGLGLSIVQRLVALQGGRCRYEKPPQGARFIFTLPA